jgi:alpha-tubulin suppressor-like RCC1 family protein
MDQFGDATWAVAPQVVQSTTVHSPIKAGWYYHSCALDRAGYVRCWGLNDKGQLGIGSNTSVGNAANTMGANLKVVNLGAGRKAVSVAAGLSHTCALLDDATLKCWGNNLDGQLGLGLAGGNQADTPASTPDTRAVVNVGTGKKVRRVTAGGSHTCVIRDDDKVVCWGLNNKGQLGRSDTKSPVGEAPADMGDALKVVSLGTNRTAKELVAGDEFTCALLDDDTVKCWGENQFGQLGLNSTTDRGRGVNDMGDQLAIVGLGGKVAQLRAGDDSVCALLADGSVKCWGHNNAGQVGIGGNEGSISDTVEALVAVNLGLAGGQKAVALGGGKDHHCAAISDGSLKCWGRGGSGQLGVDDNGNVGLAANTMGANLVSSKIGANLKVEQLPTGRGDFMCAALTDAANARTYKCWGFNQYGQLGQENTTTLGDATGEMAALQAIKLK